MEFGIAPFLYVQQTVNKGFGIFTNKKIAANTVIEVSPVIVMSTTEKNLLDKTTLYNYIFDWGDAVDKCAMAMGYVPIYNHSYSSNADYFMEFDEKKIIIKTVRAIAKGEEICINYNGDWDNATPIWFDAV
jgi:SET domain-containing protein